LLRKKQLELRSILQLKAKQSKRTPFLYPLFFFLRERKGLYLASLAVATVALWGLRPPAARNCEQTYLRSVYSYQRSEVERPFPLLRLCLATAKQNRPRLLRSCELCEAETPTIPTAREKWRHSFASAKRRGFKFSIFKVRVSVSKI